MPSTGSQWFLELVKVDLYTWFNCLWGHVLAISDIYADSACFVHKIHNAALSILAWMRSEKKECINCINLFRILCNFISFNQGKWTKILEISWKWTHQNSVINFKLTFSIKTKFPFHFHLYISKSNFVAVFTRFKRWGIELLWQIWKEFLLIDLQLSIWNVWLIFVR